MVLNGPQIDTSACPLLAQGQTHDRFSSSSRWRECDWDSTFLGGLLSFPLFGTATHAPSSRDKGQFVPDRGYAINWETSGTGCPLKNGTSIRATVCGASTR